MFIFAILVLFLLYLVNHFWFRWKYRDQLKLAKNLNSGYVCWPIIGHSYMVFGNPQSQMVTFQSLGQIALQNGGATSVWIMNDLFVVISDPEIADIIMKKCLEKHEIITNIVRLLTGNGSGFAPVKIWRHRRKLIAPTFNSKNMIKNVSVFAEKNEVMVKQLQKMAGKGNFPIWSYINAYSMDSVCESTMGVTVNAQTETRRSKVLQVLCDLILRGATVMCRPWINNVVVMKLVPFTPFFRSGMRVIEEFIEEIIRTKRENIKENITSTEQHDGHEQRRPQQPSQQRWRVHACSVTDGEHVQRRPQQTIQRRPWQRRRGHSFTNMSNESLLRDATKNRSKDCLKPFLELFIESTTLTNKELLEETKVMLVAGTDTTAVSISFAIAMLARHPDVQDKVYQELLEVFGVSPRDINADDMARLKYLEMVIKESMRLYPPAPMVVRKVEQVVQIRTQRLLRELIFCCRLLYGGGTSAVGRLIKYRDGLLFFCESVILQGSLRAGPGLTIPKGCGVIINIWAIHRNPKYWGTDAETFRPERFINETPEHPVAYIPFSYGPRGCLGYQYAMYSLKCTLASLLRQYRILPPTEPQNEYQDGPPNTDHRPLRLTFEIMMKEKEQFIVQLENRNKES